MMKKKVKITAAVSVAIVSLLMISPNNQFQQELPVTEGRHVSAPTISSRHNTLLTENKDLVSEETAETSAQSSSQDITLTESDFELPNTVDSKEISTESSTARGNPTPTPAPSKNKTTATISKPKMGDTRIVDGKQQSYFLGFGWVDYMGENEVIYCEDMYENGNKVGIMN